MTMSALDAVGMQTPCLHVLSIFAALQAARETYETLMDNRQTPAGGPHQTSASLSLQMEFSSMQTGVIVLNSQGAMGTPKIGT